MLTPTISPGAPMSALLILALLASLTLTVALTVRENRPNPAAIIGCALAITACAGFTGYLLGDVRASYMGEGIDRAIDETHKYLTAGHCEAVTNAYDQAKQARDSGATPHSALGTLTRTLREIPNNTPGGMAAP